MRFGGGAFHGDHFFLPWSLNDSLGLADTGDFMPMMGLRNLIGASDNSLGIAPYGGVAEIIGMRIVGNGHDAGSTNTWTLTRLGIGDTTLILTIPPETIGVFSIEGSAPFDQFDLIVVRFDSDDPGTAEYRGASFGGRIIA